MVDVGSLVDVGLSAVWFHGVYRLIPRMCLSCTEVITHEKGSPHS